MAPPCFWDLGIDQDSPTDTILSRQQTINLVSLFFEKHNNVPEGNIFDVKRDLFEQTKST